MALLEKELKHQNCVHVDVILSQSQRWQFPYATENHCGGDIVGANG